MSVASNSFNKNIKNKEDRRQNREDRRQRRDSKDSRIRQTTFAAVCPVEAGGCTYKKVKNNRWREREKDRDREKEKMGERKK